MLSWVRKFKEATPQTKYFVLNWALYFIIIAATTAYVYVRLQVVRDFRKPVEQEQSY